uniref:Uncharacterized protein n=1 Tax=viral metagenome TaxID=1070528 RepID=A0A6H1ZBZ4_9ZZZZ
MDAGTFEEALGKLARNFGIKVDGEVYKAKAELFWGEFRNIPANIWERTCKAVLEREDRFPTMARIKSVMQEIARAFVGEDERPKVKCDKCDGSGYISSVKNCGTYRDQPMWDDHVFRCSCANGAYLPKSIPVWNENKRLEGYVLKTEYDGLGGFEMEDGDYIAPHEEQRVRMKLVRDIKRLITLGKREKAQNLVCELDQRIDKFRVKGSK